MTFGPRLRLFWISSVFTRCDLEGESEGGVTLEALEKAGNEMGFKEVLRYHYIPVWCALSLGT